MNRDHQLQYCKVCQLKQFDIQHGIICSLTGRAADFQDECATFKLLEGAQPVIDHLGHPNAGFDVQVAQATSTKRFVNHFIDVIAFYIFTFVMAFMSGIVAVLVSPDSLNDLEGPHSQLGQYLFGIVLYITYYTVLEASTGRTLGKLVTGTRVVDNDGKLPSLGRILKRSVLRLVPFEAFSFLGDSRGWHDRWSDTWVVEKNR